MLDCVSEGTPVLLDCVSEGTPALQEDAVGSWYGFSWMHLEM